MYSLTCKHCNTEFELTDDEKESRSLRNHVEFMHHTKTHGNILPYDFRFNDPKNNA